ncbi:PilZ domain-containing protein [Sphingomonas qilianensis]|uniref:PilZ domain-containing protein n=1 Tax=Sphingomonas qilianensis TaxID=1736690 RepID=A0ABU9XNH0_9SPHN
MDEFPDDSLDDASADGAAHNRNASRDSLFLMAEFRVAGSDRSQPVRVRNLSAGGLMAEYPPGLEQGATVEIDVRGIGWVVGHIAWSAAGRVGVAFVSPIDPLLARKPVVAGEKAPYYTSAPVQLPPRLRKR